MQIKTDIQFHFTNNVVAGKPTVLILFGHVTIPYSGIGTEDGHDDHSGAWPTDVWYGDMDGAWTTTNTAGGVGYFQNRTNDFKFDPNTFNPLGGGLLTLEMAVGRIDFSNLGAFVGKALANGATNVDQVERELLKNYIGKNTHFRRFGFGSFTNSITSFSGDDRFLKVIDSQMKSQAWYGSSEVPYANVGLRSIELFKSVAPLRLWGYHGASGNYDSVSHLYSDTAATTLKISNGTSSPRSAFIVLEGSYFGDWYGDKNKPHLQSLMRASLGAADSGLAAMWNRGDPFHELDQIVGPWHTSRMGIGGTLGDVLLDTIAANPKQSCRNLYILGDPTLRAYRIAAVPSMSVAKSGSQVTVTWGLSSSASVAYHVYHSSNALSGNWTRLTGSTLSTNSFNHGSPSMGQNAYLVRAIKLIENGAGSIYDLSQGQIRYITFP